MVLMKRLQAKPLLVILWVLSASLLAGGTWSDRVQQSMDSIHMQEPDRQQVKHIFSLAEAEQLPLAPLELKLNEGVAKRVDTSLLIDALHQQMDMYAKVRSLLQAAFGMQEAEAILGIRTVWDRTVLLHQQGVGEDDLVTLLMNFRQQRSEDRWNNFRYGGGLLLALRQWGLSEEDSLSVVVALSRSRMAGGDYPRVLDLLNNAILQRISLEDMVKRIIESAPKSRSFTVLERMVR